ncbi:MAG: biotin/lipoyl-binding protein, partial [Rhodocyclaceae bacterium]
MTRRGLILALAAAGAVAAVLLWPKGREVDVAAVRKAPLTQSVVATGRIVTPARISIGSPLAATVLEVAVREGYKVKDGQVLARLRADDAEALIGQAVA